MYWAELDIENKASSSVQMIIPKGSVLEVTDLNDRCQCLVISQDIPVTIPPGRHKIRVPAFCMNREQPAPTNRPGRLTPFVVRTQFDSQDDLWRLINKG